MVTAILATGEIRTASKPEMIIKALSAIDHSKDLPTKVGAVTVAVLIKTSIRNTRAG
jgi:hypothetical protein